MENTLDVLDYRHPEQEINPLILNRWSPRALSGGKLTAAEKFALFEAAKWAPSSSNSQPWRFIYAENGTAAWPKFFGLLDKGNQEWAVRAALLIVVVSQQVSDQGRLLKTASFSAGSAWENLALEATSRGLIAHGMAGFDYERAKSELKIPADYKVEAMIAVGHPGDVSQLSENNQKREFPSDRKKLSEIINEGEFKF